MLWTDKYMAVKPDDKHLCSAEKLAVVEILRDVKWNANI